MIHIPCPHCFSKLKVADRKAGHEVLCPACKRYFPVPSIQSGPYEAEEVQFSTEYPDIQYKNSVSKGWGTFVLVLGIALVLFFWMIYDTTVPKFPGSGIQNELNFRVFSPHRQQNRFVGIAVGFGLSFLGLLTKLFGRR